MLKRYWPALTLALMVSVFTLYFSYYTILRYQTFNAYTADLSLIDQAMWNTLHGDFMTATWGDQQQPRLAEHFEPILVPLAALFWVWDDVRILLIAQALALALGAIPLYWLARQQLTSAGVALLFPAMYLLAPQLQAAAVADFHADPFVVAPFLLAFWYAHQRRWGWLWFWAVVVMSVKENMPTLVVMLGLFILLREFFNKTRHPVTLLKSKGGRHGAGLIMAGTLWFVIATFVIVAPLAETYFGSDGPVYLANRFSANPLTWPALLSEPARGQYLLGLLAAGGGLALFAPHYLLLGLPLWVANTFSSFAGQYSGEQHYSAPLVGVVMIAAVFGLTWLWGQIRRRVTALATQRVAMVAGVVLPLIIAGVYHQQYGWTPLAERMEVYAGTDHTRHATNLLRRVPDDVVVSASAGLHPHLAHRPVAYTFPTIQNANIIVVDVTDVPGVHPNDLFSSISTLLTSGEWRLDAAIDGLLLLTKTPVRDPQTLPTGFYSFARQPEPTPTYPLDLTFGETIHLRGFDIIDQPFQKQTALRLYWDILAPPPDDLNLWVQLYDDWGTALNNPRYQPAIETVWYRPELWQPGETVVQTTLPVTLNQPAHVAVAALQGNDLAAFESRLPLTGAAQLHDQKTWANIATLQREGWAVDVAMPGTAIPVQPAKTEFQGGLQLTGQQFPAEIVDESLPVVLQWQPSAPLPADYTIFLHLLDEAGNTVTQTDSQPFWLVPHPTSRWSADEIINSRLTLTLPEKPGRYRLRLGLYHWQTLERLPLLSGEDSLILGQVDVRQGFAPKND